MKHTMLESPEDETKTPSDHQRGDTVELFLMDRGVLRNCKIDGVIFKPDGIYYDVDIPISVDEKGDATYVRWRDVPGGLVDPVQYHPNYLEALKSRVLELHTLIGCVDAKSETPDLDNFFKEAIDIVGALKNLASKIR